MVVLFLVIRIAYILSANPIGALTQELVYLRVRDLRVAGFILLAALITEIAEYVLKFLDYMNVTTRGVEVAFYLDTLQAVLLLVAALLSFVVVARYTHRGLDRRIRESMETIAYLAGQRRLRARPPRERTEEEGGASNGRASRSTSGRRRSYE